MGRNMSLLGIICWQSKLKDITRLSLFLWNWKTIIPSLFQKWGMLLNQFQIWLIVVPLVKGCILMDKDKKKKLIILSRSIWNPERRIILIGEIGPITTPKPIADYMNGGTKKWK